MTELGGIGRHSSGRHDRKWTWGVVELEPALFTIEELEE